MVDNKEVSLITIDNIFCNPDKIKYCHENFTLLNSKLVKNEITEYKNFLKKEHYFSSQQEVAKAAFRGDFIAFHVVDMNR